MIYGRGDHLIDHLSHTVQTLPVFATVGFREKPIRPIAIDGPHRHPRRRDRRADAARDRRGRRRRELLLSKAVRRVASVVGRRVLVVPWPVWAQYAVAQVTEWTMKVPLVAKAQVRMLAEGVTDAAPPAASVPDDLRPRRMFTAEQIRRALPEPGGFGWRDLRVGG